MTHQAHTYIYGGNAQWYKFSGLTSSASFLNCAIYTVSDPTVVLLNLKPPTITHRQFQLCLQVTTAKQTIARAWKTHISCVLSAHNRIKQAMIHAKIEAVLLDRIPKYESSWVEHYLPSNFDNTLLLPEVNNIHTT